MQRGCDLVPLGVLVGEAGPVGAVGARVSRLGLLAQGHSEPAGCPHYAAHGGER